MRAELILIKKMGKVSFLFSAICDSDSSKADASTLAVFARVQWAPFEEQFGKIQSDLKRQTENLNMVSTAIIMKSTSALEENMVKKNSLDARMFYPCYGNQTAYRFRIENERREFLDWVSRADINEIHNIMSKKRYEDTGSWILRMGYFKNWITSAKTHIFWLHGPGMFSFCLQLLILRLTIFMKLEPENPYSRKF
jgi:hypothetical protein